MSSRKKKKNRKRDQKNRLRPLKSRLLSSGLIDGSIIVDSPAGEQKMSEVLLEFVEPYSEEWRTEEQLQKLLSVAAIAWNAALFPGSEREQMIQDMMNAVPPEVRADMRAIIEEMIQRKVTHFAGSKRAIISFEVTRTPSGPYVAVASTL